MLKRLLSTEAEEHIRSLEQTIQEIVTVWQNEQSENLVQAIYAPFGGGKTWLLQRWQKRWGGILLDLEKDPDRSTIARIQSMKHLLENAPEKYILYIDNVPAQRDELTDTFQKEILEPALQSKILVIQAQRHPNKSCWGGKIPHPPSHLIPPLTLQGAETVRRKFEIVSALDTTEAILFSEQGTLPGLVQSWCEGRKQKQKEAITLRNYLEAWWQRSGEAVPPNFSHYLLCLAILACRNTFKTKSMLADLSELQKKTIQEQKIECTESGLSFELQMKRLNWMLPDGGWYAPIAAVLKAWLFAEQPNLYSCLVSN